jgi:hypothetical protein
MNNEVLLSLLGTSKIHGVPQLGLEFCDGDMESRGKKILRHYACQKRYFRRQTKTTKKTRMTSWWDRFNLGGGKDQGNNSSNNSNNNKNDSIHPFLARFLPNNANIQSSFRGQGQSLGGTLPGILIPIQLKEDGPLGIQIERRSTSSSSAICGRIIPDSQAAHAGLQRGDILCFANSDGTEEIPYDMFLELAKSNQRPLCFEVRRLVTSNATKSSLSSSAASASSSAKTTTSGHNNSIPSSNTVSADAQHRKQAMLAAAEARDKAHKAKSTITGSKPANTTKESLPDLRSTADRRRDEAERLAQLQHQQASTEPLSLESHQAAVAAKQREAEIVAGLGYNPFATTRLSADQARTATVNHTHGNVNLDGDATNKSSSSNNAANSASMPGAVAPPRNAMIPVTVTTATDARQPSVEFQRAFETLVTANDSANVKLSLVTCRKLIFNAITKGQENTTTTTTATTNATTSASGKFRKVRLANPKIHSAIVETHGALDLMLAAGFELLEDNVDTFDENVTSSTDGTTKSSESVLIYPTSGFGLTIPQWLPHALEMMQQYEEHI